MLNQSFMVAKSTNPNYLVHIKCAGLGIEIIADMPETTTYASASDYEQMFPASSGELSGLGSSAVQFFSGTSATLQYLTSQIWKNNSPIEIPVSLLFDATTSALKEVYTPMRILELLSMPTKDSYVGAFLVAPNSNNNSMFLSIGKMFTMSNMLLVSVSNTYDTRLDKDGYPIAGQCELIFRTPKSLSRDEWAQAVGISI
jgi:hypothetical protein